MVSVDTGFLNRTYDHPRGPRIYQVYVPHDYDPALAWPVILFLHGAGEGGRDGLLPTEYQLGRSLRRNAVAFPGIVVFPQLPHYQPLWAAVDVDYAVDVLGQVCSEFNCDRSRLYLTGVSSGARAAWHALYRHPQTWAADVIVAGMVRPRLPDGTRMADPDPVVPPDEGTRRMRWPGCWPMCRSGHSTATTIRCFRSRTPGRSWPRSLPQVLRCGTPS